MKLIKASSSEQIIWKRYLDNPGDPGLVLSYTFRLVGKVDTVRLANALNNVISNQFQNLLYQFTEKEGVLYKQNTTLAQPLLEMMDSGTASKPQISHKSPQLYWFGFKIISEEAQLLVMHFSHLVFDGNSYEPFIECLENAYNNSHLSFKNEQKYSLCLNVMDGKEASKQFWVEQLKGKKLSHPLSFIPTGKKPTQQFLRTHRIISRNERQALEAVLPAYGASVFQVLLSVFSVTLYRYDTGEEAINLSHTVSTYSEGQPYGCYMNVVPISIPQSLAYTPKQYVKWVKDERRRIRPHQNYPTNKIIGLAVEKINRGGHLLNIVINHSQGLLPLLLPGFEGSTTELVEQPEAGGPFDLALNYSLDHERLWLSFEASQDIIGEAALECLADNFIKTLSFFVNNPRSPIKDLSYGDIPSPAAVGNRLEKRGALSLREHLLTMLDRDPSATAVVYEGTRMDYHRLKYESLTLAQQLLDGYEKEKLGKGVGVFLTRTHTLPVAVLACLLLEVPFVPLEPNLPESRLNYMLDVSGIQVILTDLQTEEKTAFANNSLASTLMVDIQGSSKRTTAIGLCPGLGIERCYVMFTSGSTGNPKGVAISRYNLLAFLHSMVDALPVSSDDYLIALTSISFDISILELVLPIFTGATVEVISDQTRQSAALLADHFNSTPVTMIQATPSVWQLLKAANWKAKYPATLLTGGEALDSETAAYLLSQGKSVHNMYGPTEATIWASVYEVKQPEKVLLGKPTLNTAFYVLDENLMSVGVGMRGQLAIQGDCVGLGYLNYDNSKVFVTLPETGQTVYLTGDIVINLGKGEIQYVGREGSYIKMNGYRIEPREIDAKLARNYPDIKFITVLRQKPEHHLCSFYWSKKGETIPEEKALLQLKGELPYYMVPRQIVRLQHLPLLPSGKLNVKLLSQGAMDTLPLAAPTEKVEAPHVSKRTFDSHSTLNTLKKLLYDTLEVLIEDSTQTFGSFGLTSISYNQLSEAILKQFGVRVYTHEFYQYACLDKLMEAIHEKSGQPVNGKAPEKLGQPKVLKERLPKDKIAIVGYTVMMPQSLEAASYWQALANGQDLISPALIGESYEAFAGFLQDVEMFDARFFSISPLEAMHMDPRQRLLMQTAWRTLEDAAYRPSSLMGQRVGCYVAATGNDFASMQAKAATPQIPYSLSGYSLSMLANRISSFFDWHGPSFVLDTACSGGLSALVKACRDVAQGVCDAAFVGAVNLILDPQVDEGLKAGNFISPNHRCASFDSEADGYTRGEGLGGVLIKPLAEAVRDGDHIHGVIEAYAENHGGRSNSLTAPNPKAQTALLLEAYTPTLASEVSYLETHGTGTKLGDPIEIDAIKEAWAQLVDNPNGAKTWLGSVKSNTGHLEAAAGMASLAKVLLAIKHRTLPANIHFNQLNSLIKLEDTPFEVLAKAKPWDDRPRLKAGISSFGFGGANAHVVVAEPPTVVKTSSSKPQLFLLSAKTEAALALMCQAMLAYFQGQEQTAETNLSDIAYTLAHGREHFEYRIAWIASDYIGCVDYLLTKPRPVIAPDFKTNQGQKPVEYPDNTPLEQLQADFLNGVQADWAAWYADSHAKRASLPTYRFVGKQFKLPTPMARGAIAHVDVI